MKLRSRSPCRSAQPPSRVVNRQKARNRNIVQNRAEDAASPENPVRKSKRALRSNQNVEVRHTRLMTLSAAQHAVLSTTELLEKILMELPFHSIHSCKCVCKHFSTTIDRSKLIQPRLWLHCGDAPRQTWTLSEKFGHHIYLPADDSQLGSLRRLRPEEQPPIGHDDYDPVNFTPARLCPILQQRIDYRDSAVRLIRSDGERLNPTQNFSPPVPWSEVYRAPSTWIGTTSVLKNAASWAQTFVSEPPPTKAYVEMVFNLFKIRNPRKLYGRVKIRAQIQNPRGLRMGDVIFGPLGGYYRNVTSEINGKWSRRETNPSRFLQVTEKRSKVRSVLDMENLVIKPDRMVFPSEEEWRTIGGFEDV